MNKTMFRAARTLMEQLRHVLARDEAAETRLAAIDDPDAFRTELLALAQAAGIAVGVEDINRALNSRRRGGSDAIEAPPLLRHWPSRQWLPVRVVATPDGECVVDWAHFGGMVLDDPFFETSIQRAVCRPFNRIWPYRMSLADFIAAAPGDGSRQPTGLIFHMSRCGSTLVAQMLASTRRLTVLSEAPPLDAIVQLKHLRPQLCEADHIRALAAMAAALSRQRVDTPQAAIFKLDCWHLSALPLFRAAFPGVPWIYLYREPVEAVVSHMRRRGLQMVPGQLDAAVLGIESPFSLSPETYCAEVLDRLSTLALAEFDRGGGRLVNYDTLPDAVSTAILPHFGIDLDETDRMAMQLASTRSAKVPTETFSTDKIAKQRAASDAVRAAVGRGLADRYAALEARRQAVHL